MKNGKKDVTLCESAFYLHHNRFGCLQRYHLSIVEIAYTLAGKLISFKKTFIKQFNRSNRY